MNKLDLIIMSMKNLWRRKLRTSLTIIGVMIGTASIVLMISLGLGMERQMTEQMKQWGDITLVDVSPVYNGGSDNYLDEDDIELMQQVKNVEMVIPTVETSLKLIIGREANYVQIQGLTNEAMQTLGYIPAKGELYNDKDKNVIVVGQNIKNNFSRMGQSNNYGGRFRGMFMSSRKVNVSRAVRVSGGRRGGMVVGDVYGLEEEEGKNLFEENIKASYEEQYGERDVYLPDGVKMPTPIKLTVVGELEGETYQKSDLVYAPVGFVEELIELRERYEAKKNNQVYKKDREKKYYNVRVKVNDVKNVTAVTEELKAIGFEAWGMAEAIERTKEMSRSVQLFLGSIGGVALLIAGIGITNTMIMAIYERKKEIGIMKVIGSNIKDIKRMFLTEAALIGFWGGIVGLIVSYTGSYFINKYLGTMGGLIGMGGMSDSEYGISYIPEYLALTAIVFSAIIGLIAGYLPARRAMKMSVLQAIKDE